MKKIKLLVIVFGLLCLSVNAIILKVPFVPEEFDVDIYQYPYMIKIDNALSEQIDTYYDFTNSNNDYEIRYSFFREMFDVGDNIKTAFVTYMITIVNNVAGYQLNTKQISAYQDKDVKNEFNGDFGFTVFMIDPKSDFGKGYKYIMINFFYKKGQGMVTQSLLFNDRNIIEKSEFLEVFHSFRFHE
jgi:hypothetical protein